MAKSRYDFRPLAAAGSSWWRLVDGLRLRPNAYLVPLRLFIGIGWLRSAAEKLFDPAWHNGDVVTEFVGSGISRGSAVFPGIENLLHTVVEPSAPLVAGVVLALQIVCGAGILVGSFTNAALLIGIGMNLVFMLAGVPNPSAFYVLMQVILLITDAGAIVGFDGRAAALARSVLIAGRSEHRAPNRWDQWCLGGLSGGFLVVSIYAFAHGTDFTPAGSVNDPALVLGFVTGLASLMLLISSLRPIVTFEVDLTERLANLETERR